MSRTKKELRRAVERRYAEEIGKPVETAHAILIHDPQLFGKWKRILQEERSYQEYYGKTKTNGETNV